MKYEPMLIGGICPNSSEAKWYKASAGVDCLDIKLSELFRVRRFEGIQNILGFSKNKELSFYGSGHLTYFPTVFSTFYNPWNDTFYRATIVMRDGITLKDIERLPPCCLSKDERLEAYLADDVMLRYTRARGKYYEPKGVYCIFNGETFKFSGDKIDYISKDDGSWEIDPYYFNPPEPESYYSYEEEQEYLNEQCREGIADAYDLDYYGDDYGEGYYDWRD